MITSRLKLPLLVALLCGGVQMAFGQATPKEQEAKLIAVLKSGAEYTAKADACRELALVGTAESVPVLAALLADEKLSHMARYALEPIPSPTVDEALRQALGKLKGRPLVGVIGSVGVRHDAKAVVALTGMLKDPDAEVAQAAARSLGRIATPEAAKALQAGLTATPAANRLAFCEGLLRCAEVFLADGKKDQAGAIYDALRKLPDAPHQVRTAAWRGLVAARPKDGTALLLEMLRSTDPVLATAGLQIAMELKNPSLSKLLADDLGKAPAERQIALANVLGKRGDAVALPALLSLAKAGDKEARAAAVSAIVEIGSAEAAVPLVGLLVDADAQIAQTAAVGLSGLQGGKVDDALLARLTDPATDRALRLKLIEVVRQRRIPKAMPVWLKLMDENDAAVRAAAIKSYAEVAGEAELPGLLERIAKAKDAGQVEALGQALVSICGAAAKPDACVPALVAALAKVDLAAKPVLLQTLRAIGGAEALKAVRVAVGDSNKDVHTTAIRVLGEWKTAEALPVLLDLAKTSTEQVDKILSLRGYLGMASRPEVSAPDKLAICRAAAPLIQRDDERRLLLGVLGGLADAATLDLVVPMLEQPAVKKEAGAVVIAIADKKPPQPQAAAAKAALEKVVQIAADDPATVKRAQDLIKVMENQK